MCCNIFHRTKVIFIFYCTEILNSILYVVQAKKSQLLKSADILSSIVKKHPKPARIVLAHIRKCIKWITRTVINTDGEQALNSAVDSSSNAFDMFEPKGS